MINAVLSAYGMDQANCSLKPFGSGLINNTWLLQSGNDTFILQRINQQVFKNPIAIAENISMVSDYLEKNNPGYNFVRPVKALDGKSYFQDAEFGHFRLFPFVSNSSTVDTVSNPQEAYEAATQFGNFTFALQNFDATRLHITIPDFHNLVLRYWQFLQALKKGSPQRHKKAIDLVRYLQAHSSIVDDYKKIISDPQFKIRVTHHDTKISNVLFSRAGKGICVIDLDTVMPGYFLSDVGDMMRTYLSPVSEEEKDFDKIEVRNDFFDAIVRGYLSAMQNELTSAEKAHFVYAGKFMIYMQALRFLTDYLNNDIYYGQKYEGHNLVRAQNQAMLLKLLIEKEDVLQQLIANRI